MVFGDFGSWISGWALSGLSFIGQIANDFEIGWVTLCDRIGGLNV